MLMYLLFMMYMSGLLSFTLFRKHFLLMLMSLEFIILTLYMSIFLYLSLIFNELFFMMIFLTMSVCESSLGLAMLILMVRLHGNDYILTFSSLW